MARSIAARISKESEPRPHQPPQTDFSSDDEATRRPAGHYYEYRARRPGAFFELADGELIWADSDNGILPEFLLGGITLTDLHRAGGRVLRYWAGVSATEPFPPNMDGYPIHIVNVSPAEFWPIANHYDINEIPPADYTLLVAEEVLCRFHATTGPSLSEAAAAAILAKAAERSGIVVRSLEPNWLTVTEQWWEVQVTMPRRARTVADLLAGARACRKLLEATGRGEITYTTAVDLLHSGYLEWMRGQRENHWLEAKVEPWIFSTPVKKIEFAQDVARFANASGGIIVLGAHTSKADGIDTIDRVDGIRRGLTSVDQLGKTLDAHLYPPVDDLDIWAVPHDNGNEVFVIAVPPQPERNKPFLVHGALVDGVYQGEFFSIVRRRGERSVTVTAREIHAWLTAGRGLLDHRRD